MDSEVELPARRGGGTQGLGGLEPPLKPGSEAEKHRRSGRHCVRRPGAQAGAPALTVSPTGRAGEYGDGAGRWTAGAWSLGAAPTTDQLTRHQRDCGKQVYLVGFDTAHAAARAYDRAAIKFRGNDADINFNFSDYEEDLKQTKNLSKEEFVQILHRRSNGFSRGSSKYRGVTLHKCGRWEARMGQLLGKKYIYI